MGTVRAFAMLARLSEQYGEDRERCENVTQLWRTALRARSYTASGPRSRRHLKCPSGHSRWKQGLQAISIFAICATGDSGGVNDGEDDPNSAISGAPTAAAACNS